MNTIDVIVFLFLAYGLIKGLIKGFIVEIAGMIALVIGVLGAFKFSSLLGAYLGVFVNWDSRSVQIVSFILLFMGIIFAISLIAKMITKVLQVVALGLLNRLLGGLFGLLKWFVILSVLVLIYEEINQIVTLFPGTLLVESISYPFLRDLGTLLFDWVIQNETIQQQKQII
ncbi:MAG: CvpA family protein [Flavobacteriaceae bacterium]